MANGPLRSARLGCWRDLKIRFTTLGFKCCTDLQNPLDGVYLMDVDKKWTHRIGAGPVGLDQDADGSGVGVRSDNSSLTESSVIESFTLKTYATAHPLSAVFNISEYTPKLRTFSCYLPTL